MRLIILITFIVLSSLASDKIVISDFEEYSENTFPKSWGIKKGLWYTSGKGNSTWTIKKENDNKYLSANSNSDSYTIGKKYKYNLKKFKYISWKWRVHKMPSGGNEEKKKTGDSAAGVYVLFPGFAVPYSIKYVWSTTREVGTIVNSPFTNRSKIIVIKSGKSDIGKWITEKRNVYQDFIKVFKVKSPDKKPQGIALLSDSDNTKTSAKADYDDIFALKE